MAGMAAVSGAAAGVPAAGDGGKFSVMSTGVPAVCACGLKMDGLFPLE